MRNRLVVATDPEAVRDVLQCSGRTALTLTQAARDARDRARDAVIEAGRAEGKSNRQIAREVGVSKDTVRRNGGGGAETQPAEMRQPDHDGKPAGSVSI